ncbi:MAG: peptidoglycan-binding protein [Clostridia bacterium]|nr:peptidoglycan-binding protein [Clostridia bacterium]
MPNLPIIPEYITVHLGAPDTPAQNVSVPFADYIKNVASSEIFPTWPENAIRANIYAQISYALNRIYTEYYPSRGYNFDITNSTTIDQSFVYGRDIFENISQIVDEIFNNYVTKGGGIEPYFTAYCDGREIQCNGLEQWGTVSLAEQGLTPFEILQFYYGDDIEIVMDAPVGTRTPSYPNRDLSLGAIGNDVQSVQIRLNRISKNYPSIPKIYPIDGVFGPTTESAVMEFQRAFNLTPDGIVGKATWYKIIAIFNAVKRINDLASEGISLNEVTRLFNTELSLGDSGPEVFELQYLLSLVGAYEQEIPIISIDGSFGEATESAVKAFQRNYGISDTGVVAYATWDQLYRAYLGILGSLPEGYFGENALPYPGMVLRIGSQGESVRALQEYLNYISRTYSQISPVTVDGIFGPGTQNAVREFQSVFGLTESGIVGAQVWDAITSVYRDLYLGTLSTQGQFPGYEIQ